MGWGRWTTTGVTWISTRWIVRMGFFFDDTRYFSKLTLSGQKKTPGGHDEDSFAQWGAVLIKNSNYIQQNSKNVKILQGNLVVKAHLIWFTY